MTKIQILIIDDSMVVRHLMSEIISADPGLEVMGTASNGKLGLEKLKQIKPDVVILDIEMPEMDGLQALAEIRKLHPRLPVIMCSTLTSKGAEATFKALSLGASDYVAKPTNTAGLANSKEELAKELLPKIHLFGARFQQAKSAIITQSSANQTGAPLFSAVFTKNMAKQKIDIVAIGVSTGGPNALEKLLTVLPKDFPVPIVIVQHMPANFTKMLADHLHAKCAIPVSEAKNGETLESGKIWIAPGGSHMILAKSGTIIQIRTNMDPPENSCRPAVDVLFRSVNELYKAHTLAVVLTGMGSDGLKGCELIRASGGQILVQDEATSVVWGMPGFVAKSGLADAVLPLEKLAEEIVQRVNHGRALALRSKTDSSPSVGGKP